MSGQSTFNNDRTRYVRTAAGAILWLGTLIASLVWLAGPEQSFVRQQWLPQLWKYSTGQRSDLELSAPENLTLISGDPIFIESSPGEFRQVGEVRIAKDVDLIEKKLVSSHVNSRIARPAFALLYPDAPSPDRIDHFTHYETPRSMNWVMQTMLPPAKRAEIIVELTDAFEHHHGEIVTLLRPLVEDSLRDALIVVEEDLPATLAKYQPQLQRIGTRYQRDLVQREIVPLVREEIWPIVRREVEPAATEIGQEIWQRASLWRFGWRFAYDRSPLPERNLVKQEWTRFLEVDALPVIKEHTDELIQIQQNVLAEIAKNEEVQHVMRKSVAHIIGDKELQQVVGMIVRDLFVENPKIQAVFDRHWRSEEAHAVYQRIGSRLEPTVVRIGEILLGSPEDGITPEFARVLRNRILNKEQRWLVVELADHSESPVSTFDSKSTISVTDGETPRHNPFVIESPQRSKP